MMVYAPIKKQKTQPAPADHGRGGAPPAKTATNVRDADWTTLAFGKPFANKYDGAHVGFGFGNDRNRLTLQMATPPDTVRAPFEPKVHSSTALAGAGGGAGGGAAAGANGGGGGDPSFVIELDGASHAQMLAFEATIKDVGVARRAEWFAKGKHAPTARPSPTSDEQLRWDFRSSLKEGNADKGWRPTLRIGLSKSAPPTILLTELKPSGKMAAPRPGTVEDLRANAALVPTIRPNGGVWIGALGFGVKWVLETCLVVTNQSAAAGARIDMGDVEFEPAGEEEAGGGVLEHDERVDGDVVQGPEQEAEA